MSYIRGISLSKKRTSREPEELKLGEEKKKEGEKIERKHEMFMRRGGEEKTTTFSTQEHSKLHCTQI